MKRSESTDKHKPEGRAESLGSLVEVVIDDLGLTQKLLEYRTLLVWEEVVGPGLAPHATPLRIQNGRLELGVSSAVWRTRLNFVKKDLAERLNQKMGQRVVKEVILVNPG